MTGTLKDHPTESVLLDIFWKEPVIAKNIVGRVCVSLEYCGKNQCYSGILWTESVLVWNIVDRVRVSLEYCGQSLC